MKKCCTQDCNQGRSCPNKATPIWTVGDLVFTAVMLVVTVVSGVAIVLGIWQALTSLTMLMGGLK